MSTYYIRADFKLNALTLRVELVAKAQFYPEERGDQFNPPVPACFDVERVSTPATKDLIDLFVEAELLEVSIPGVRDCEINAGPDYLCCSEGRVIIDDQDLNDAINEYLLKDSAAAA